MKFLIDLLEWSHMNKTDSSSVYVALHVSFVLR